MRQPLENQNKAYHNAIDHNRVFGNNRKTCPFFEELNRLNSDRPNVTPTATLSSCGMSTVSKRKCIDNVVCEEEASEDSPRTAVTAKKGK